MAARLATLVALPIIITLMLRGESFIGLWMGTKYAVLSGLGLDGPESFNVVCRRLPDNDLNHGRHIETRRTGTSFRSRSYIQRAPEHLLASVIRHHRRCLGNGGTPGDRVALGRTLVRAPNIGTINRRILAGRLGGDPVWLWCHFAWRPCLLNPRGRRIVCSFSLRK